MNWTRGLFRLWLVLSILWVGVWFLAMRPDQAYPEYRAAHSEAKAHAADLRQYMDGEVKLSEAAADELQETFLVAARKAEGAKNEMVAFGVGGFGVSLGLLVIGGGLIWAFRGFRPS